MKAPAWWQRYLGWRLRRDRHDRRVVSNDNGFVIVVGGINRAVRWDEILQVEAYKKDLWTVDLLCLAVTTADGIIEIDEEMDGYTATETQICARLAVRPDWRSDVLFPAFAANPTILFPVR